MQQVGYNLVSWSYTEKHDLSSYLLTPRIAPTPTLTNIHRYVFKNRWRTLYPYEQAVRNGCMTSPGSQMHRRIIPLLHAHRNSYSPLWTSFASNFAVSRIRFFFFLSSRPESRSVSFNVNQYGGRSNIASLFITVGLKAIIFMVRHRNR